MKLINLTPHAINFIKENDTEVIPSSGVARVSCSHVALQDPALKPYNLVRGLYGNVENLPEPEKNVLLIVSAMVKTALPLRADLVSPALLVRDEKGNIVGCKGFEVNF